ncbi:rhamnan synthesis F family protein [Herbiconiux sp. CPCC 203407]|uniref:Rhamnan synthesis F family protein n=1 Tax=Herbiconiux oxytropis TaxID=2970915 RepID=A0AA42BW78_9MICO|nr:rhamnan synthesis F family protein [Herbiconiux oxytropis]MCS5722035.1 rhamnan synthesis F family protein [Herbiconiux oxytropis]MCS5725618.1 rhamnan synthesis F family protein [Herbiconiux oxytropis]
MGRRVLDSVLPASWIESERRALPETDRVAVVASWGAGPEVSLSLSWMVTRLEEQDYSVVVVRASDDRRPLDWSRGPANDAIVVRKPNIGYDFGSWATAIQMFPAIRGAQNVLITNDSLVGPFSSLGPMVADFEGSFFDVWGGTWTSQFMPHLQSFLLGFKGGVLEDPALRHFWSELPEQSNKTDIIDKYELGLSRLLHGEGFVTGAWFDYELVVEYTQNPTILGWRRLLDLGFPFVKRELVTNPSIVADGLDVPAVVEKKFGIDPTTWV